MEIIEHFIKKEINKYTNNQGGINSGFKFQIWNINKRKKYEKWINSLKQLMIHSKYRQVLTEIEKSKKYYESISQNHWKYKIIQLKAIFKIIKRKLHKYSTEIIKENSKQNHSVLFWFNQSFIILEQMILEYRDDLNKINLKARKYVKPVQCIYLGHIQLIYLLINYSYLIGENYNIYIYLAMVDRLSIFSGYMMNTEIPPILQKIFIFRIKISLANCDYLNGIKYVKKTIYLCLQQLNHIIDFDYNLNTLNKSEENKDNTYYLKKLNKRVVENNFVNMVVAFFLRGIISENLGEITNAMSYYKQSRFIALKLFKRKYYNKFIELINEIVNNGYSYVFVLKELKKYKENKEIDIKIKERLLHRQQYYKKLKYQRYYDKYYSNIKKNNLYSGELKKFLDDIGETLYKEEKNRQSVLTKFTKTRYITSTMNMINMLLSEDFKNVLKKLKTLEITKPSIEMNSLINKEFIKNQIESQIVFKKNINNESIIERRKNDSSDLMRDETINNSKNLKKSLGKIISNNNSKNSIKNFSCFTNRKFNNIYNYKMNNRYEGYLNQLKIKNKSNFNKSEETELDTLDNEYSIRNSSFAMNSLLKKSNSTIFYKKKKDNSSINYIFNCDKSTSTKFNYKTINNKMIIKPKYFSYLTNRPNNIYKFKIDKDIFSKNYLKKKLYLDKYFSQEILFQKKLLQSKSCELECTKEPIVFDLKKTQRDAELTFNKVYELCKSSLQKKNFDDFLRMRNLSSNTLYGNTTTVVSKNKKKKRTSLEQIFKDNSKKEKFKLKTMNQTGKKFISFTNEKKMKEVNMDYTKLLDKENGIIKKKRKLLKKVLKK